MSLKGKAKEVLKIIEEGGFKSEDDEWVDLREQINFSTTHSKTYFPDDFSGLAGETAAVASRALIEVTEESTQIAAKRLYGQGIDDLVLLNFASARNPGGGFINGAKSQEEDLSRCSTLYQCLLSQPQYYEANRKQSSMLYTDHIIYSPQVPWFRTRSRDLPKELFFASVITAPAPNAGQAIWKGEAQEDIEKTLRRRSRYVLEVAKQNGHQHLLLGAWGCGVFANDPYQVARSFCYWLNSDLYSSTFKTVAFAIYDNTRDKCVLAAFKQVFTG